MPTKIVIEDHRFDMSDDIVYVSDTESWHMENDCGYWTDSRGKSDECGLTLLLDYLKEFNDDD